MVTKFEFVITKKHYAYVECSSCRGIGKKTHSFNGNKFIESCIRCKGSGREKLTRRTEVNLIQALKELNLIS